MKGCNDTDASVYDLGEYRLWDLSNLFAGIETGAPGGAEQASRITLSGYDGWDDLLNAFQTAGEPGGGKDVSCTLDSECEPTSAIEIGQPTILAGGKCLASVRLAQASNRPTDVMLRSSHPEIAAIPHKVTVPAGATTGGFLIATSNPRSARSTVLIQALLPDGRIAAREMTVRYNFGLSPIR